MIAKHRFVSASLLLLVAMLFFVFVSDDSEAATHTVDKFGGSDYTNITQAVDNASAGDIIRVASRNYHDAVEVDKKLTIIGGNYGSEMGNLYDCNNGDLVAKYSLDEEDPSEVEDGVWCDELNGDVEGASTAAGVWGNGLDFDGTNDYVEIDHDSVFNLTDSISIALWFNWDTDLDDSHSLVSTRTSLSGAGGFELMTYNDYVAFAFNDPDSDGEYYCDSTSFLASNTWHHVAVTYDGSNVKIYNNGTLDLSLIHI